MSRALILRAEAHEFGYVKSQLVPLDVRQVVLVWEDVDKSAKHRATALLEVDWRAAGLPEPEDFVGHLITLPLTIITLSAHWEEEINRKQQPVLAVDFDGVIAEYHGWKGDKSFGEPLPGVTSALRRIQRAGWVVVIWTTREPVGVWQYCTKRGIPVDGINSVVFRNWTKRKICATVYLDDRGMKFPGQWSIGLVEAILDFHPHWESAENLESFEPVTDTGMKEAATDEVERMTNAT